LQGTNSYHIFWYLINSFGLTIGLRVISGTEALLGI
jgi:hypothetical protein